MLSLRLPGVFSFSDVEAYSASTLEDQFAALTSWSRVHLLDEAEFSEWCHFFERHVVPQPVWQPFVRLSSRSVGFGGHG